MSIRFFPRAVWSPRSPLKSGGSLRELMCLVQGGCIEATADKIDQPAIDKAITNVRSEFIRPMPQAYLRNSPRFIRTKTPTTRRSTEVFFFTASRWNTMAIGGWMFIL